MISTSLLNPYKLGNVELKNRIVMSPMTRSRAIDNIPNELMADYYRQRSGAGLIITEGTSPSPNGLGYCRIPGIYQPGAGGRMGKGHQSGSCQRQQNVHSVDAHWTHQPSGEYAGKCCDYGALRCETGRADLHRFSRASGFPCPQSNDTRRYQSYQAGIHYGRCSMQ